MKKFALLLMTLMFAIFTFAAPSQANEFDEHSNYEHVQQDQQVHQNIDSIVVYQSVDLQDTDFSECLVIKNINQAYRNNLNDILADDEITITQYISKIIYKEPNTLLPQVLYRKVEMRNVTYTC